jgi:hypothetical protein
VLPGLVSSGVPQGAILVREWGAPYSTLEGYPTDMYWTVGQRMERGRDCVERNRSERAEVANVAEWKPPASPESFPPCYLGMP